MVSSKPSLSDQWRVNKSEVLPIELANSIRALRKVIGVVDPREMHISYACTNESYNDAQARKIVIDPTFATKHTPISPDDFDVLVGLAAHEGLHSRVDSANAIIYDGGRSGIANQVSVIGEEIYTDTCGRKQYPILGQYINKARRAYNVDSADIPWGDVFNAWKAITIYGHLEPAELSPTVQKQLTPLMLLTKALMEETLDTSERKRLYMDTAEKLMELFRQEEIANKISGKPQEPELVLEGGKPTVKAQVPKADIPNPPDSDDTDTQEPGDGESDGDSDLEAQPGSSNESSKGSELKEAGKEPTPGSSGDSNQDDIPNTESDEEPPEPTPPQDLDLPFHTPLSQIPEALMEKIQEALDSQTDDITVEVNKLLGEGEISTSYKGAIIWRHATTNIDDTFDKKLARELVWIKELKNSVDRQTYRAEKEGIIDKARLYRAGTDGAVFKVTKRVPQQKQDLVLLLDASSSMHNRTELYDSAKALHRIIPEANVFSYADNGEVIIQEHSYGRAFRAITTMGGTPSGLALLAVAKHFPESLIIHFTDGDSNKGSTPTETLPLIHSKFPHCKIINIHYGGGRSVYNRYGSVSRTHEQYPELEGFARTVRLENIADFPQVLKESLKDWYR